ncbi:hypothetical protein [Virgibacillus salexigens]|uniref:Uncharacterized protein n=1 Tax=Virgibacillus massiliensis TaxID=1462526 RepID=A0A024QIM4_9BACI|nr:hypothetical protein [Virgibacillus massiliensis]CDQ41811.1 hypothetical protein BN990_04188 [Virgibacillus massiliensis]
MIIQGSGLSKRTLMPQRDNYNRKDTRVEYQLYSQEYFSGADMHIYFGDIWVDEITSLEFSLKEEILPIYGYNSYTYDEVVRGRRQIMGAFSMNFKSVSYLQQVLQHAEAIQHTLTSVSNSKGINIEHYEKYKLDEILRLYGKESFEQIAEEYERAIWGEETEGEDHLLTDAYAPYFQRNNPYGFNLRINYGAVEESYRNNQFYSSKDQSIKPNLTVETVNGVQITGVQKRVATADQGAPIQEVYSFMAQDLNGSSNTL